MNINTPRVMFYVQHLLGIGHVRRAALIAEAMSQTGLDVHVILGGATVDGIPFKGCNCHRLPEARAADASFSSLVDKSGSPITKGWKNNRCEKLLSSYEDIQPDILLIELFPFGRRQFRFELIPLLQLAKNRVSPPHIACSVRDILVSSSDPVKQAEIVSCANDFFNTIIVHGDAGFLPFQDTFPDADQLKPGLLYSGYVCPSPSPVESQVGTDEVIVAAGGGAVGAELLLCAAKAKRGNCLHHKTWRLLCGPNLPGHVVDELNSLNDPSVIIEPNRPDYPQLLQNCALSISQGGYNTLMDIIHAGCPSVVVPFGTGKEDEQRRRTALLADKGYLVRLDEKHLTPSDLSKSIDQALAIQRPNQPPFNMNGARETAKIIQNSHEVSPLHSK